MATSPTIPDSRVTLDLIRSKKGHQRIRFVTVYDFPTGKLGDEDGFDMILVGDTLAEVVLGHETTLPVTFEAMLHHTSAARRAVKRALLVADLPYGSYHASEEEALRYAVRFIKEGGAQAVKLEGGRKRVRLIRGMLDAEIATMGHIGLTPQSVHRMGGYRVQGRLVTEIEASGRCCGTGPCRCVCDGAERNSTRGRESHFRGGVSTNSRNWSWA